MDLELYDIDESYGGLDLSERKCVARSDSQAHLKLFPSYRSFYKHPNNRKQLIKKM